MQFSPALVRHGCHELSLSTSLPRLRQVETLILDGLQAALEATVSGSPARVGSRGLV